MNGEDIFGLCLFVFMIAALGTLFLVTSFQTSDDVIILRRTETGITCRVDNYYPETNCKLLVENLGLRLSELKVEK